MKAGNRCITDVKESAHFPNPNVEKPHSRPKGFSCLLGRKIRIKVLIHFAFKEHQFNQSMKKAG